MTDFIAPGMILLLVFVQSCAFVSIYLSMRKFGLELKACTPDQTPDPDTVSFEWLKWLLQRLKTAQQRREAITRETATAELDSILLNQNALVILHKTAIVAPLFGVIVTALGFFSFELPTVVNPHSAESGNAVFSAVRPLAWGVMLGALLAIVNQILLYFVGQRMASFRQTARLWLEQRQEVRGEFVDTATAGLVLSQSVEAVTMLQRTAERHNDYARQLKDGVEMLAEATRGIRSTVNNLSHEVKDLQSTVGLWHTVTQETEKLITASAPQLTTASTGLDHLVKRFHETFDERLFPALERQATFSSAYANLLANVESCSQKLGSASGQLVVASETCAEAWHGFQTSWQEQIVPTQTRFQGSVERMDLASLMLAERLDLLSGTMGTVNHQLTELSPELKAPLKALGDVSDALKDAVENHLIKSLRTQDLAAASWHAAATAIGAAATEWTAGATRTTEAANSQATTARSLEQLMSASVIPAWSNLQHAASSLLGMTTLLTTNIEYCGTMLQSATTKLDAIPQSTSDSFAQLQAAVGNFAAAVDGDFSTAAKKHALVASNLELTTSQMNAYQQGLLEQSGTLQGTLTHQQQLLATAATSHEVLGRSAQKLAVSGETLQSCISQQLAPSSAAVAESLEDLKSAIGNLTKQVAVHLKPASESAVEFNSAVTQLRTTLESLQPLTQAREDFRHMSDAVKQISAAVQAINHLPEKLEQQRHGNSMLRFIPSSGWWKSKANGTAIAENKSEPPGKHT